MSSRKKILMICDSDLSREPRLIRQIIALKDDYQIHTAGQTPTGIDDVIHHNFNEEQSGTPKHWNYPLVLRKAASLYLKLYNRFNTFYRSYFFEKEYWTLRRKEIMERLSNDNFDAIIAHHWDTLPLAYALGQKSEAKLLFNAHDYYPRQFEENEGWTRYIKPHVNYVMDKYLPKFHFIFSAWTKIHEDFQKKYGVPSIIINNATEFNDLQPQLRTEPLDKIKIIHHGIANPNRKIESMIEMMQYLDDRFVLDFILVTSPTHYRYLEQLKEAVGKSERIRFLDAVDTRDIARTINSYDIGLFLLPPNGFNPTFLLPNKLFEFIQGRLACLVSPSVEMKTIVEKYDLGWISKDFEPASIANEIKNLTIEELNIKKQNAHKHALELSAEKNYELMKKTMDDLLRGTKISGKMMASVSH